MQAKVQARAAAASLPNAFRAVRGQSEALCRPLETEDYQVQSVPEVSPPKWHLAHVTWFFETFVLGPFAPRYRPFHPRFEMLFNSYYQSVGSFHPRNQRHVLSRPTVAEVLRYRAYVDERILDLLERDAPQEVADRIELGLHHEQQHQELLLMDIKRNFFANPLFPAYRPSSGERAVAETPMRWREFRGGLRQIGHEGGAFCFDNETPRHTIFLRDYRLASRLVTNEEYRAFIEDRGYERPELWLADGWATLTERGWRAPLYWQRLDGGWHEMTLHGLAPLELHAPVCHVSYYEADAFARWHGSRLPTEAELECAVEGRPIEGNFVETGLLHPRPAQGEGDGQWFGDAWEWSASPYTPYPGFRPLPGALGEYNGKFMANQFVLRGGCCATPRAHQRPSYRNFFYPVERWAFSGIRLARDAD